MILQSSTGVTVAKNSALSPPEIPDKEAARITDIMRMMIFPLGVPAFAANLTNWWSQIPVVHISGDREPLYDADGNQIFKTTYLLGGSS